MEKITGLIDAPFTPFYENGDVNLEPIPAYAKMLQKNGLKGVFINGSSGEGYMLTPEERIQLAEAWMAAAPEGFKVIVHVGSCCVRESHKLAEHAQKIGGWGIGAMAPPFPKIGRIEELVKYCEEIGLFRSLQTFILSKKVLLCFQLKIIWLSLFPETNKQLINLT